MTPGRADCPGTSWTLSGGSGSAGRTTFCLWARAWRLALARLCITQRGCSTTSRPRPCMEAQILFCTTSGTLTVNHFYLYRHCISQKMWPISWTEQVIYTRKLCVGFVCAWNCSKCKKQNIRCACHLTRMSPGVATQVHHSWFFYRKCFPGNSEIHKQWHGISLDQCYAAIWIRLQGLVLCYCLGGGWQLRLRLMGAKSQTWKTKVKMTTWSFSGARLSRGHHLAEDRDWPKSSICGCYRPRLWRRLHQHHLPRQ